MRLWEKTEPGAAFGLIPEHLNSICALLEKEPAIETAILFGSRAKGNYRPGSDVDLALAGRNLTHEAVRHTSFVLNEETLMPYRFDVLNFETLSNPALREHIERAGIVFFQRSATNHPTEAAQ